jgi:hypothetical protein
MVALEQQAKEDLLKQDVALWDARQRVLREHVWEDYHALRRALRSAMADDGVRPGDKARVVKELGVALSKLIEAGRELGLGLQALPGQSLTLDIPADMAADFQVYLASKQDIDAPECTSGTFKVADVTEP